MKTTLRIVFALFTLSFFAHSANAHILKNSNSEVDIQLPQVTWKIQVHLNDYNQSFEHADQEALKNYLTNRLRVMLNQKDCDLQALNFEKHLAEERVDLKADFSCPQNSGEVELSYGIFYGDSEHRHIAKISEGNYGTSFTFSPENTEFTLKANPFWQVAANFMKLGLEHILSGLDHILFVLCLVLGAIRFSSLFWLVTSFTLAHSISLALATFGIVNLSPHAIEPAIAGSLIWVALWNILTPQKAHTRGDIFITFFFGLLHGLGFSSALKESHLFGKQLVLPLLSFNLGVEIGQVLIILISFPLLALMRRKKPKLASLIEKIILAGIVLMAAYWLVERLFFFKA